MDERKLLDLFIQQMKPPIVDDLIPDEPPAFVEAENCAAVSMKFSIQDGAAYDL